MRRLLTLQHAPPLTVSIHAPWEGCDLVELLSPSYVCPFQFTHPGKGATFEPYELVIIMWCFNSRTLGRVRLRVTERVYSYLLRFNSRTLGRVRLEHHAYRYSQGGVSIHAPWEGCDSPRPPMPRVRHSFNSRTLGRVRQCGAKVRIIGRINKRNLRLGVLS